MRLHRTSKALENDRKTHKKHQNATVFEGVLQPVFHPKNTPEKPNPPAVRQPRRNKNTASRRPCALLSTG
jgi:hypothetical protein